MLPIMLSAIAPGPWMSVPLLAWPALFLTIIGLALHRASRDPRIQKSDAVLVDLCLGLVTVTAGMFWLVTFLQMAF
jgi:apolipoprotein N-acyltransferase